MNEQPIGSSELEKISDTRFALADASQDLRGRKVADRHGDEIGHVSDLFIDAHERKVRLLEIRAGGFLGLGDRHFLLPVDAVVNVAEDTVHVNQTRERIMGSPAYDPDLIRVPAHEYWEPFYGYYGLSPYWGAGYSYPGSPLPFSLRPYSDERSGHARDL